MAQSVVGNTPVPVKEERAIDEVYKHSIIESSYTPHTSLLSFVSGQPTLVEYYRGSYGRDEEQHGFQPDSIETYQSYKRIRNLIIKTQGDPSFNFTEDKAQSEQIVNAYVLFDLTPGMGDLFIRDIGEGRAGLFQVNRNPEIMNVVADKCYSIEAVYRGQVTKAIMDNLDLKVIEELYYQKDIAVAGGNAVLTKTDHDLNKKLYDLRLGIVDEIMANNYYHDEGTIAIPNDSGDLLYDPYLTKFLTYTFPTELLGMRDRIRLLNVNYWVQGRQMQEPLTIWDMFYRGGFDHPERYQQKFFEHTRNEMINTRNYGDFFFSKMDRAIVIHKDSAVRGAYTMSGSLIPTGPAPKDDIPQEGKPWSYYFTDDFYTHGGSELTKFVWQMWKDKTIDKAGLVAILDKFWDLSPIDKIYMGGIYVGACKTALVKSSLYT